MPIEVSLKLKHTEEDLLANRSTYMQLIGKLMYVALTKPGIAYSVHELSQFMDKLAQIHLDAAFKVLRYLKNAPDQGLFLSTKFKLKLVAFSNSDWAGCQETRRYVTVFYILLSESLIG